MEKQSTNNFADRYQQNMEWLAGRDREQVSYRVCGQTITFQSRIQEFLSLLARRYGCFFTKEAISPAHHIKLSEHNGSLILTGPDGNNKKCRHLGEVFFPHVTHVMDTIYRSLINHVVFHAASMESDGNGFMIIGRGGVGKTTLMLAMIKNKMSFLADDVSIVELTPAMRLLPNPLGIKTGPHGRVGSRSPHVYKNPFDIFFITISTGARLSGAVLLLPPENAPPDIEQTDWTLLREKLQKRLIPPSTCEDSLIQLRDIFSRIPFAIARPQKGNIAGSASMIERWFEEKKT